MLKRTAIVGLSLLLVSGASFADDAPATQPTTQPTTEPTTQAATVDPTDTALLIAKKDQTVTVEGTVKKAAWAGSGKLMFVDLAGVDKKGLSIIAFVKDRAKLDAAFNSDITAALTGAKIQVTGKVEIFKDRPEIIINDAEQVKIIEPAK